MTTPILKNLVHVVRRFKLATVLNVLGLSVAFAAFMVIMMQLHYHHSFDRFHENADKIFRVESQSIASNLPISLLSRPIAERFIESSPHIVAGAIANQTVKAINPAQFEQFFYVEKDGARNFFRESSVSVSPEFTDVFTFDIVEGSADALKIPRNVLIPLSLSRRLFGNESAIGQRLVFNWGYWIVGGVFRDFPSNSILENCIYFAIDPYIDRNNWHNYQYNTYIRVNDASIAPLLIDNFIRNFEYLGANFVEEQEFRLFLTPLTEIHFLTDIRYDFAPKISRQALMILLAIAIVIIVIAAINFVNFSTALMPMRIKNINTQRVLGAQQSVMRIVLVAEAVFFCLLSYAIAIFLFYNFATTPLASLISANLSLAAHPLIFGGTALVALLTGLLAGTYSAFYLTSFEPALVLKGSFGLSPKGKQLRNTLIAIQFIASCALIIGASFINLQNRFMQKSHLGYNTSELLVVDIGQMQGCRDVFTNQLKAYSGVKGVTFGLNILSSADNYMTWFVSQRGQGVMFQVLPVHYTFLNVLGIEITEGRDFRQDDAYSPYGAFILNEAARKQFNLELNTTFEGRSRGEIIGFINDIKFGSFRTSVAPMAFYVRGTELNTWIHPNIAYIRLMEGTNMREAMRSIHAILTEFDPDYIFEIRLFEEILQRTYKKERSLGSLISLFSILAIFISIVGVFGLVVFDSECRRKEIGIRKVMGASTIGIILMFNKAYIKILLICFAISVPVAWFAVGRWLENFAFRTPMYWWVFALAFVAVGAITALTVTIQNWRVANDDPVKSIKTE